MEDGPKKIKYTCRVCMIGEAIYQCPRCLTRSCSIECVKKHKVEDRCSGRRHGIEDKAMKDMDATDLERDLRFLDAVGCSVERNARQDSIISAERYGVVVPRSLLPNSRVSKNLIGVKTLREKAEKMHVYLKVCPPNLTRRKINTTCLSNSKTAKVLRWRIDWLVHLPGEKAETWTATDRAVSQETKTSALIGRFFSKTKPLMGSGDIPNLTRPEDYLALMLDESLPANERGYLKLDPARKLKEWLAGSVVVEFPAIHLVPVSAICTENTVLSDTTTDDSSSTDNDSSGEDEVSSSADSTSSRSSDLQMLTAVELTPSTTPPQIVVAQPVTLLSQTEDGSDGNVESEDDTPPVLVPDLTQERAAALRDARGPLLGYWKRRPVWEKLYLFDFPEAQPKNLPRAPPTGTVSPGTPIESAPLGVGRSTETMLLSAPAETALKETESPSGKPST
eukprot:Gregarina_sp_Poly_1__3211@NODE_1914_length_3092_cov_309_326612_g1235_i0_p1_GENE_NODE_1914_length_3092_cov_309_326612_g1235_i0NODE_1914_length_3092_cov_309_326612_g1235_i0_p1_ORF_typecomplete_len450_score61_01zfHIT/PF04438_16/1_2e05XRN1_D1/PF18332_1/0_039_NODE_1914_length_3092_cov_309_326612_g1235_i011672516